MLETCPLDPCLVQEGAEAAGRIREPGLARGGDEKLLIGWGDAGFAGPSTKSQTGIVAAWAGGVVTWRSSRQATPALHTCEAEAAAAVMNFIIIWGLRCLLIEWGIELDPPLILVDKPSGWGELADPLLRHPRGPPAPRAPGQADRPPVLSHRGYGRRLADQGGDAPDDADHQGGHERRVPGHPGHQHEDED